MDDLKMLSQDEVAALLHTARHHIGTLREIGVLRAIKTGKRYVYPQEEIRRFQKEYKGKDVSNRTKALEAFREVSG